VCSGSVGDTHLQHKGDKEQAVADSPELQKLVPGYLQTHTGQAAGDVDMLLWSTPSMHSAIISAAAL